MTKISIQKILLIGFGLLILFSGCGFRSNTFSIETRQMDQHGNFIFKQKQIDPSKTAVVVIDMWGQGGHGIFESDRTFNGSIEGYLYQEEVTRQQNETLAAMRAMGIQVVFTPAGQAYIYHDHPARQNIKSIPDYEHPWKNELTWNENQKKIPFADWGGGGYEYRYPGSPFAVERPGTKTFGQNPNIVIMDNDLITDDPDELWNFISVKGIELLIYMGGSSNMCLAGRPFGVLNMIKYGMDVIVDRNYNHLVHRVPHGWNGDRENPQFGPFYTNERNSLRVIDYYEQNICPTFDGMVFRERAQQAVGYNVPVAPVVEAKPDPQNIRISFQPQHIEIPAGFIIDTGWEYGEHSNGLVYGWNNRHVHEMNRVAFDPLNGAYCKVKSGSNWRIEVDNGLYQVTAGLAANSINTISVLGQTLCMMKTVSEQPFTISRNVSVRNKNIALNFTDSTKVSFIIIKKIE